jgi:Lar family restriction alleviation protein
MKPLPCPFCGGKPTIQHLQLGSLTWVICYALKCPANPQVEARTRQEAIQKWNDRPAQKAVA